MVKDIEAVERLLADPITFMINNIIDVSGYNNISGIQSFTLDDSYKNYTNVILPSGKLINGYYLQAGDGGGGCFEAFWCSYIESTTQSVVVNSSANLMFTARMSGCSLGIGSPTPTGARLVSHTNALSTANFIVQDIENREKSLMALRSLQANRRALFEGRGTPPSNGTLSDKDKALDLISRSHQQHQQRLNLQTQGMELQEFLPNNNLNNNSLNEKIEIIDEKKYSEKLKVQLVEPWMYRLNEKTEFGERLDSTTFGIRNTKANEWGFYVQKHGDNGQAVVLVGVAFVGGVYTASTDVPISSNAQAPVPVQIQTVAPTPQQAPLPSPASEPRFWCTIL